ncbi:MAG: hypothetical protein J7J61_03655 [Candidatus Hydrothermae bacterium]|nr:hypothetical protein [Candidatus Hydrothermae bacterium]
MAVETAVFKVTLSANAVETTLSSRKEGDELRAREGEIIRVLEVGAYLQGDGYVYGYASEKRVFEFDKDAYADTNHRVVTNIELRPGESLKFTGTDTSGSSNTVAVLVVFERTTA